MIRWGLAFNVVWEFGHSPLYADWHRERTYLLWTRLHCTVGDVLILPSAFWLTSVVFQTRHWIRADHGAALLFVLLGVGYTIWSEWYNISISASWGYAPAMPVILGIGLSPVLLWVLLPPLHAVAGEAAPGPARVIVANWQTTPESGAGNPALKRPGPSVDPRAERTLVVSLSARFVLRV